jgi:hypothetical protein
MRRLTETADGVTVAAEVRAVVLLMGLMVSSLLVYLVLTEVSSRSVLKSQGSQPDKNLTANVANVTAVDH